MNLLPCPFCGFEPRIDDPAGQAAGLLVGVECSGCGSQSPTIAMWNMRTSTSRDEIARKLAVAFHGDTVEWRGFLTKADDFNGAVGSSLEPKP